MSSFTARAEYLLYAATVFVSSFLLFQVQPLLGKHILPWFGGSPAVWITAMFFFMVVLALGYLYALLLSWLSRELALLIHVSATVTVAAFLFRHSTEWPSAITPLLTQVPALDSSTPMIAVCVTLTLAIGLPFFILSSTSSLLQYWYAGTTNKEPFSLYAVSNTGSLLGLLSYPFFFEPFFSTYTQGRLWTEGFSVYGMLLMTTLCVVGLRGSKVSVGVAHHTPVPWSRFTLWVLIAAIPVATMLTGTSYISGYIAPIPFLWVIPLGLYLISFIVSFRSGGHVAPFFTYAFTIVFATMSLIALTSQAVVMPVVLVFIFATMFSIFHLCHEALYAMRPVATDLTRFYVALSFGGIVGSVLVLCSSLYVLPIPIEFSCIIAAVALFAGRKMFQSTTFIPTTLPFHPNTLFRILVVLVLFSLAAEVYSKTNGLIDVERNFFGYKAVYDSPHSTYGHRRTLVHGTTNHGYQFLTGEFVGMPVAYYSETSGVARVFAALRADEMKPLRVAVVGLGSGALAAYCEEKDTFDYFEIDPEVITLAQMHCTYLADCPDVTVHLGDARLQLQQEYDAGDRGVYDLIVIDAYADDMVPIHIMTADAIAMYQKLLTDDGILAVHISSRYLSLEHVMAGTSERTGMPGRYYFDRDQPVYAVPSNWTFLANREGVFSSPLLNGFKPISDFSPVYWTDTYSSLISIVHWW